MTEKLKKRIITDLVEKINDHEFQETGDLIVKVNDKKSEHGSTLINIYRKAERGATIVIPNLTIRECYNFLQGYKEAMLFYNWKASKED